MVTQSPAADDGPILLPETQWVVFVCEEVRFGFPLESVSEILTPRPFTRLPGTGPEVCGLVGVHSRVITVIDLGVLLGLRAAVKSDDHRLLLLDVDAHQIGVVVERVTAIETARLERRESGLAGLLGTGHTDEGEFTAADPRRLLAGVLEVTNGA
jgi:chemotaxis signal transduction protein